MSSSDTPCTSQGIVMGSCKSSLSVFCKARRHILHAESAHRAEHDRCERYEQRETERERRCGQKLALREQIQVPLEGEVKREHAVRRAVERHEDDDEDGDIQKGKAKNIQTRMARLSPLFIPYRLRSFFRRSRQ